VPAPKWLVVARNEYRIHTSRIRKIRSYFLFLAVGVLFVYVAFIAPALVGVFIDDFLAFLLSQAAVAMVQVLLFTIFIYFIIIPITGTLREEQTGQVEIFLAAPIKPSDVLLGEFLGELPFYAIFITVATGFLTAILNPLGLDLAQMVIVVMIFVITFLSALWIGNVIAALLRTRLGRTARGKDIGRGLAMIIALPMVALIYAIQFGGLISALADPNASGTVKAFLSLLPSSWGAEVIVGFALNPGNISAMGLEILTRFGGLVAFFLATLWLGARAANRAYSLEPTTFIASRAKPDGAFYNSVRSLGGGGSFGTLLVSVFKDYGRRLENLSNVTYIIGLLFLMSVFIAPTVSDDSPDVPVSLIMAQFLFPIVVVMVTGEVTVNGKEALFIYRKAPDGEGRLIKAMLLKSWLIAVPIAGAATAAMVMITMNSPLVSVLTNIGLMMLYVAAYVAFVLGLFLLNPAFSPKSVRLWLNVMIAIFSSIGLFAVSILVLTRVFAMSETFGAILYVQLMQTAMSWLLGVVFLFLGKMKLSKIE